jgi:hypothetical protein
VDVELLEERRNLVVLNLAPESGVFGLERGLAFLSGVGVLAEVT